jgi:hypothetical protein
VKESSYIKDNRNKESDSPATSATRSPGLIPALAEEDGSPSLPKPSEVLLGRLLVKIEAGNAHLRSLQSRS